MNLQTVKCIFFWHHWGPWYVTYIKRAGWWRRYPTLVESRFCVHCGASQERRAPE